MKKACKTVLIVLVVLLVVGAAIGGYFIYRHNSMYIGRDAALQIALRDAGVSPAAVQEQDVEFERNRNGAWYDIDFETAGMEYSYSLDAATGEILYRYSEPEHG